MSERFCIVVPHFEHAAQFAGYLPALTACGLDILIVDDGSSPATRERLRALVAGHDRLELIERQANGGKGAAIVSGLRAALARGYSHAIGVDADGQHDPADIVRLQQAAREHPGAIVSGLPLFGDDIPRARLYGRMITNTLVQLEAGGRDIRDAMCGLRCYPLAEIPRILDSYRVRYRMDFDPEVLVRAAWLGIGVRHVTTRVRYPQGGVSHFRMFRDNVDMTSMHIRLLAGALLRLPGRALRRIGRASGGAP